MNATTIILILAVIVIIVAIYIYNSNSEDNKIKSQKQYVYSENNILSRNLKINDQETEILKEKTQTFNYQLEYEKQNTNQTFTALNKYKNNLESVIMTYENILKDPNINLVEKEIIMAKILDITNKKNILEARMLEVENYLQKINNIDTCLLEFDNTTNISSISSKFIKGVGTDPIGTDELGNVVTNAEYELMIQARNEIIDKYTKGVSIFPNHKLGFDGIFFTLFFDTSPTYDADLNEFPPKILTLEKFYREFLNRLLAYYWNSYMNSTNAKFSQGSSPNGFYRFQKQAIQNDASVFYANLYNEIEYMLAPLLSNLMDKYKINPKNTFSSSQDDLLYKVYIRRLKNFIIKQEDITFYFYNVEAKYSEVFYNNSIQVLNFKSLLDIYKSYYITADGTNQKEKKLLDYIDRVFNEIKQVQEINEFEFDPMRTLVQLIHDMGQYMGNSTSYQPIYYDNDVIFFPLPKVYLLHMLLYTLDNLHDGFSPEDFQEIEELLTFKNIDVSYQGANPNFVLAMEYYTYIGSPIEVYIKNILNNLVKANKIPIIDKQFISNEISSPELSAYYVHIIQQYLNKLEGKTFNINSQPNSSLYVMNYIFHNTRIIGDPNLTIYYNEYDKFNNVTDRNYINKFIGNYKEILPNSTEDQEKYILRLATNYYTNYGKISDFVQSNLNLIVYYLVNTMQISNTSLQNMLYPKTIYTLQSPNIKIMDFILSYNSIQLKPGNFTTPIKAKMLDQEIGNAAYSQDVVLMLNNINFEPSNYPYFNPGQKDYLRFFANVWYSALQPKSFLNLVKTVNNITGEILGKYVVDSILYYFVDTTNTHYNSNVKIEPDGSISKLDYINYAKKTIEYTINGTYALFDLYQFGFDIRTYGGTKLPTIVF